MAERDTNVVTLGSIGDALVTFIELVRSPLLVLDAELRVQAASRAFYRTFHVMAGETLGQFIYDLGDHQWDIPDLRKLLEDILPTHSVLVDYDVRHDFPSIGLRTMVLNAARIHRLDTDEECILLAFEDISDSRLAKEASEAAEAAEEANRRKTQFLAVLAHELRNPLAPIRNALQILQLIEGGEAVKAAIVMMQRQVGQVIRLVDDLLDVSRISQGKIELRKERIELASLVYHAVEAARSLCESMHHEMTIKLPAKPMYVNADSARLTQVVGNLLSNAIKFTNPEGHISLVVETNEREAVIRVVDNGIGIAADQTEKIFEMFTQGDVSLERSQNGLGIGLMLVKELVEMHGGSVTARSGGVNQGSEFIVRLPIMAASQLPLMALENKSLATAQRRILIVDDNRDSADSLAALLKLCAHEVYAAYDGLEAVKSAAQYQPDVILLDIGLPKLNGYEACRRIRKQQRDKAFVVVALTGWGQEDDRRRSREAGFDAHLVKPVNYSDLVKYIEMDSASLQIAGCN